MKKLTTFFILFIIFMLFFSCGRRATTQTSATVMTVRLQPYTINLYFSGKVEPFQVVSVVSPVTGIIKKKYFKYGTAVAKDQLLFLIDSTQAREDYQTAVSDYLKAQRDYTLSQNQFLGSTELKKHGIISESEFLNDQARNQDALLHYQYSKNKLTSMIERLGLSLPSRELVLNQLQNKKESLPDVPKTIRIFSPETGIAFKSSSKEEGIGLSSSEISGKSTKAGDILIIIGEMSDIQIPISVNEVHIELIKIGQKVRVTGFGFSNASLEGTVTLKERQPLTGFKEGEGAASYLVTVTVPHLSAKQQEEIRAGMTTKVEIPIEHPPSILVPLTAVQNKDGSNVVIKLNENNQPIEVPVEVGETTLDSIEIRSGLKSGDKIEIPANV